MDENPGAQRPQSVNFVKEAFTVQYNLIGLAGSVAFAAVSGSLLPLLLAAGVELMYLSLFPQNARFQRLVRSWKYAEERRASERRLTAIYAALPQDMQKRYDQLGHVCAAIRSNYEQLSYTSQILVRQMEERLLGLLSGFLRLLSAAQSHREYLDSTDADQIDKEVASLQRSLQGQPEKVQEINKRRVEILRKRLEKFDKIKENRQIIDAQCAAMEDVLELVRDQSVTMRDPQKVSDQLGSLVQDVEQTEATVRQVESFYQSGEVELDESGSVPMADSIESTRTREPGKRTPIGG